nr:alpha/beta hydrolase [Marinicella sp. W31]MDC2876182.1 alpha/beta hydrolase [Marinicella sp. W31]
MTCVAVNSGVSWAVKFASRYPELADKIVIAGSPYPPSQAFDTTDRSIQAALSNAIRQRPFVLTALVRSYAMLTRSPKLAARAYRHAYRDNPVDLATVNGYIESGWALDWLHLIGERATAAVVADLAVNERGWENEAVNLQLPLFFLHGGQDTMCPPEAVRRLQDGLASSDLHVIPDAGHHIAVSHFAQLCAIAADNTEHPSHPVSTGLPDKATETAREMSLAGPARPN